MAFFNLTRLGLQDPIKAAVSSTGTSSGRDESATGAQRTAFSEPVYPNSEANGSHVKYTERLHKHIRPKLGKLTQKLFQFDSSLYYKKRFCNYVYMLCVEKAPQGVTLKFLTGF